MPRSFSAYSDADTCGIAIVYNPNQLFRINHLGTAADYLAFVRDHFLDRVPKMFYFTSASQMDILLRNRELHDNANPAGSATMVLNLICLGRLLEKPGWVEKTRPLVGQFIRTIIGYPFTFARGVQAYRKLVGPGYIPVVVRRDSPIGVVSGAGPEYSFLVNRPEIEAELFICACYNYSCELLVSSIRVLTKRITPDKASSNQ